MKRKNKYLYLYVLQGNYAHGFEDLCASESWREMRDNLREYRENEGGAIGLLNAASLGGQINERFSKGRRHL